MRLTCLLLMLSLALPVAALSPACEQGRVFEDRDADGRRDPGEPGIAGVAVSDGVAVVRSDASGAWTLPAVAGRTRFVIKPAGWRLPRRADGLPDFWRHQAPADPPSLKYGGLQASGSACRDFALLRDPRVPGKVEALLFGDPQPRTATEVGYYERDIVEAVMARYVDARGRYSARIAGDFGLTLGDVVDDDLSLYPAVNRATTRLALPWFHAAGNHDLDLDAAGDADSLATFRNTFGPDTFAFEEHEASFVVLDDVIHQPGSPAPYVGGLRAEQLDFLAAYLGSLPAGRLVVIAAHIPFFEPVPGRESFRAADRAALFALLARFDKVLLLTAHGHVQRHVVHDASTGWLGHRALHEYNVGAACGAYWSGVKDARGIPAATMADGTPNGWARLTVQLERGGPTSPGRTGYRLHWESADPRDGGIGLHAPRVLRQGAYPAYGVYANVYMAQPDAVVEFRVDDGGWARMTRVDRPDPRLVAENVRDDESPVLRGYDRSPEAVPSSHLWRAALPTHLPAGEHRIHVRTRDPWRGELTASATYRLVSAAE